MKINELIGEFSIFITNEEKTVYDRLNSLTPLHAFNERDRFVIENLIRKSLVSKVQNNGMVMVLRND